MKPTISGSGALLRSRPQALPLWRSVDGAARWIGPVIPVTVLAIPVDPLGGALSGDAHFGGDVGDRAVVKPLDQASSSLDGEWGITVCHRAGPSWSRTAISQFLFSRRGPACLLQSRVINVRTRNN